MGGRSRARTFDRIDFPYMSAVILPHHYIVDFLTPTPTKTILNFEDEIDRVRETPDDVIRKNVEVVMVYDGETPIRMQFLERPREALECLIEELRFYWNAVLAPHWAQMVNILENDVLFRARALALYGSRRHAGRYLGQARLSPGDSATGQGDAGQVHHVGHRLWWDGFPVERRWLAVSAVTVQFAWRCEQVRGCVAGRAAMVTYADLRGARFGLVATADGRTSGANESLALVVGASRARLLQTLIEPIHTNELAQRLSLTAGAVSQQLGKLAQAGLIESYRSGSKVYYQLSDRGGRLLEVFDR